MKNKKIKEVSKKKIKGELSEFKTFLLRGNILDLAVGVIIGGAFSSIVSSLVDDILMPFIGIIIGGIDFKDLSITLNDANIMYGNFIQNVIDFFIIAVSIFVFVKIINKIMHPLNKKEDSEEKIVKKEEVLLLEEIRDLLKK